MKKHILWLGFIKKTCILKKSIGAFLLLLLSLAIQAQQVNVTGTVKDSLDVPLIGVTVVQKGTTNGMMTDMNGGFSLTVPDQSTLVFSMIGFKTREVVVQGSTPINIILSEEVSRDRRNCGDRIWNCEKEGHYYFGFCGIYQGSE